MRESLYRHERPNLFKRMIAALRPTRTRHEERTWDEPPPDIGVREPRRPRPHNSGGAAVVDLPPDLL